MKQKSIVNRPVRCVLNRERSRQRQRQRTREGKNLNYNKEQTSLEYFLWGYKSKYIAICNVLMPVCFLFSYEVVSAFVVIIIVAIVVVVGVLRAICFIDTLQYANQNQ